MRFEFSMSHSNVFPCWKCVFNLAIPSFFFYVRRPPKEKKTYLSIQEREHKSMEQTYIRI